MRERAAEWRQNRGHPSHKVALHPEEEYNKDQHQVDFTNPVILGITNKRSRIDSKSFNIDPDMIPTMIGLGPESDSRASGRMIPTDSK